MYTFIAYIHVIIPVLTGVIEGVKKGFQTSNF